MFSRVNNPDANFCWKLANHWCCLTTSTKRAGEKPFSMPMHRSVIARPMRSY